MHRVSQFGVCLLAILLIAAVAQCAVVCQTSPLETAKSQTKLPPCHKQSKSSKSNNECSHPQTALRAATVNLSFDSTAALPAFAAFSLVLFESGTRPRTKSALAPVPLPPPLCLRV
jgi:hypothetical protein